MPNPSIHGTAIAARDFCVSQQSLQRHPGEPLALCKAAETLSIWPIPMRKRWTTVVNLAHRLPLFAPEFSRISGRNSCRFVLVFPFQMSSSVHTSLPNNFPHHTPIGIRSYSPSQLCPRASAYSLCHLRYHCISPPPNLPPFRRIPTVGTRQIKSRSPCFIKIRKI